MAHSSGAHIVALMSILVLAPDTAENDSRRRSCGMKESKMESISERIALSSVKGLILLSGVYDITRHLEHEKLRGIDQMSPMLPSNGYIEKFRFFSPTQVLSEMAAGDVALPPILILHGDTDVIVPVDSSLAFADQVLSKGVDVQCFCLDRVSHAGTVLDFMIARCQHRIVSAVASWISSQISKSVVSAAQNEDSNGASLASTTPISSKIVN